MNIQFVHRQIQSLVQGEVDDSHPFTWSTLRFTVCTLNYEGRISGVTLPVGKLRPRAGHGSPSRFPTAAQRTSCPFHRPRLLSLVWEGFLSSVRPHWTGSRMFTPSLPSLTITCLGRVALFTQESRPALRSRETRRRPRACLGTCHPFAGPVGDTRFVW